MNVSGIRPYEGFYQYNSIKLNELRNQQIAASAKAAEQANGVEDTAQKKEEQEVLAPVNQTFDSYDFAQQYRPDETYELKGIDSDIESLDAKKAVSDLEKDQVLQQYQYFVGDKVQVKAKENAQTNVAARLGENFFL